jgi:hypothetical protein
MQEAHLGKPHIGLPSRPETLKNSHGSLQVQESNRYANDGRAAATLNLESVYPGRDRGCIHGDTRPAVERGPGALNAVTQKVITMCNDSYITAEQVTKIDFYVI